MKMCCILGIGGEWYFSDRTAWKRMNLSLFPGKNVLIKFCLFCAHTLLHLQYSTPRLCFGPSLSCFLTEKAVFHFWDQTIEVKAAYQRREGFCLTATSLWERNTKLRAVNWCSDSCADGELESRGAWKIMSQCYSGSWMNEKWGQNCR